MENEQRDNLGHWESENRNDCSFYINETKLARQSVRIPQQLRIFSDLIQPEMPVQEIYCLLDS